MVFHSLRTKYYTSYVLYSIKGSLIFYSMCAFYSKKYGNWGLKNAISAEIFLKEVVSISWELID